VAIALNFASPNFLNKANLSALVLGLSFNAIVAVGMTILLISGGFDLSVGSSLALAGAVAGYTMTKLDASAPVAVLFGLGTGAAVGLINGLIIAKVGVNPLIPRCVRGRSIPVDLEPQHPQPARLFNKMAGASCSPAVPDLYHDRGGRGR
jgi:predicted ABC-type sugar transport system permease subunit